MSSSRNCLRNYEFRKARIAEIGKYAIGGVRLRKRSTSNLFRYSARSTKLNSIDLGQFNHVLAFDSKKGVLEVEGLTTYEDIVKFTLPLGFIPKVTPELKHITVGGAIVGIGIESSCFRHGFVHDSLLEADVLLFDGRIVTCRADNEYSDLFFALPNSYGTLGYVLRAKIELAPATQFVRIENTRFTSVREYLDAMEKATEEIKNSFVDGLFYSRGELYLARGQMVNEAPETLDIYRKNIYYKLLRRNTTFYLRVQDYLFRYDPDWFWNIPEGGLYYVYRRLSPLSLRKSGFYNRYVAFKRRLGCTVGLKGKKDVEQIIQDWEVPWEKAVDFTTFVLDNVDIQGQPWVAVPIRTPLSPTNYPIRPNLLYLNIGCYCYAKKPRCDVDFYYTRIIDRKCFDYGGIKMLYSSSFLDQAEFSRLYNGAAYGMLKKKYDPAGSGYTLFEKAIMNL